MNKAEILQSTVDFMIADQKYVSLISRTLIQEGQLRLDLPPEALGRIRLARADREQKERVMLDAWAEAGIE